MAVIQNYERSLVRALFSFDNGEIERISNLLKPRQFSDENKPKLVSNKPEPASI